MPVPKPKRARRHPTARGGAATGKRAMVTRARAQIAGDEKKGNVWVTPNTSA